MPQVRRAADRFVTQLPGIQTRHVFSFGRHYDPAWVGHGPLVTCDEHRLEPGTGFDPHPHRDLEIVSWVLEGELRHEHAGRSATVRAGGVQRMSAGSGVRHAERAGAVPTRFLQLWLIPDRPGGQASYEQVEPGPDLAPVAWPAGPLSLGTHATVHVGRLAPGPPRPLPPGLLVVAGGEALVDGVVLHEGDAARLAQTAQIGTTSGADLLLCELPAPDQE